MRKTFSKLLACCLVVALALTVVCVGTVSASEAPTGTITVGTDKVDIAKVKTSTIPITLETAADYGFAGAQFSVAIPAELQSKITSIAVSSDNQANPAKLNYTDANNVAVVVTESSTTVPAFDDGKANFLVESVEASVAGPKQIVINITFDLNAYAPGSTITELHKDFAIAVSDVAAGYVDGTPDYYDMTATDGAVIVNYLRLLGASAIFDSDYKLFFYVNKAVCDNFDDVKVKIIPEKGEPYFVEVVDDMPMGTGSHANDYEFFLPGISASHVADKLTATVVAGDYEGTSADYNLVTYALNRIKNAAKESEKLSMAAFLEYASAAQVYFHKDEANPLPPEVLADADVPEAYRNKTDVSVETELAGINKSLPTYISGATVEYLAQIVMDVYVNNTNLVGGKIRANYVDNGALIDETPIAYIETTGRYGMACDKISIANMVRPINFTLVNGSGEDINVVTYSFRTYAARNTTDKVYPLAVATLKFSKAFALFLGRTVSI